MRVQTLFGLALIVLGLLALVYQGISYTTRDTVLDFGPLQATTERQRTLPLPPLVGIAAMACGGALLLLPVARRKA